MKSFFRKINNKFLLFYIILIAVFLISLGNVLFYFLERKKEADFNSSLVNEVVVSIKKDDAEEQTEPIDKNEVLTLEEEGENLYPDISVNLDAVKSKYKSAVGWLYCPDTKINYPVMQAEDNVFYIDKLPDGTKNSSGSLFMDFRDNEDLSGFSHTIYGHNMTNDSMFTTLLYYRKEGFFEEHPYFFYFTKDGCYRLEVFAGVNTTATANIYNRPITQKEKEEYLNSVIAKSCFSSEIEVTAEDNIMLLSTCSGAAGQEFRFVLFAKIVPII